MALQNYSRDEMVISNGEAVRNDKSHTTLAKLKRSKNQASKAVGRLKTAGCWYLCFRTMKPCAYHFVLPSVRNQMILGNYKHGAYEKSSLVRMKVDKGARDEATLIRGNGSDVCDIST
ncbi:unnamed protein product [Citrullus colocynthis]|uniref:Uncharacterized protein n=1 Tax=Citrullus colocynthis TaxID=252529 RepID=A0ABP0YI33_9ROSI